MIHPASRASLAELYRHLDGAASSAGTDALSGIASQLYAVAELLVGQPQLRRALGDGSTDPQARAELVSSLFGSKIGADAVQILRFVVARRWSSPWDLTDAVEIAGDELLLIVAQQQGQLASLEDELFRLERILAAEGELTSLLDETSAAAQRRVELLHTLIAGKVNACTDALLEHAVESTRKRSLLLAVDDLLESVARRQNRSIAKVTSAAPLSEQQQQVLSAKLSQMYGIPVSVQVAIDSAIAGGLVIRIGDELIDASIARRIADVKSALAV